MRVQTAIRAKIKKNRSLLQYTNAVARHKSARADLGSSDQSNISGISYSARKDFGVSALFRKFTYLQ